MEIFFSAVFYFFSASFSADTQRDALSRPKWVAIASAMPGPIEVLSKLTMNPSPP